jgi:hypothetical protein
MISLVLVMSRLLLVRSTLSSACTYVDATPQKAGAPFRDLDRFPMLYSAFGVLSEGARAYVRRHMVEMAISRQLLTITNFQDSGISCRRADAAADSELPVTSSHVQYHSYGTHFRLLRLYKRSTDHD